VGYEARLGSTWRLVVDGLEGPEYSPAKDFTADHDWWRLHRRGWVFERPDLLSYVGVRDREVVRWEVQIRQGPSPSE
jgi:hypothetical protein